MMGGHNPSKGVYKISYLDDLKNLTADHSDWSPSQIRKEAAIRFRPRFRQDKASSIQEARNEAMSLGPEFILKDGEVYYPEYGMSANELNERTLRLNPSEYSLAQHQATAVMNEAFGNGATEVVTAYHREGEDHRDLVVMKYDPVTGKGKMTILNTAQDGNFHKFQDMQSVAKSQFVTHYEMRPANNVFILSDKPLAHQKVQKALGYVEQRIALVLHEPDRHVVSVEQQKEVKKSTHKSELHQSPQSDNTSQKRERRDEVNRVEQGSQFERLSLTKIREKPGRVLDVIQKRHREMTETKRALHVIAETHVVVGAVPVFIAALAENLPKPMVVVEKSMSRHNKKEVRRKQREFKRALKVKQNEIRKTSVEIVVKEYKRRLSVMNRELRAKNKKERQEGRKERTERKGQAPQVRRESHRISQEVRKKRRPKRERHWDVMHSQRMRTQDLHKEYISRKTERKLWHILRKLARKQEMSVAQELPLRKPKILGERKMSLVERPVPRSQEKKKEVISHVSLALTLWLLLKLSASHEQPKLIEQMKHIDSSHAKEETFVQKEPAPWVLLSIIWYLAMIREQGMSNTSIHQYGNTTNKQTNTPFVQNQQFLPQGVIFAYLYP